MIEMGRAAIKEKTDKIVKELQKPIPKATAYSRGPIRDEIMTMSVNNGELLRLWSGTAEFEVFPDKSRRQAVVQVHEDARTFSEILRVSRRNRSWSNRNLTRLQIPNDKIHRNVLLDVTPQVRGWVAPGIHPQSPLHSSRLQKNFDTSDWKIPAGDYHEGSCVMELIHDVPETDTAFLVGMDETAHFVAQLPEKVQSVDEAHDVLKPALAKGVNDVKRQGEWFFVPVTNPSILKELTAREPSLRMERLETFSSHSATMVNYQHRKYALGLVVDRREGHHKTLLLPTWHRVIRNLEVNEPRTRSRRRWD